MKILTMGVEEEFVLVDRTTRAPVNRAPEVIRRASRVLGEQVQTEFFNAQVEICTRATASRRDLRDELSRLRATVGAAAREVHCMTVACGTPVLPPEEPLTVTDTERYRLMARRFASLVTRADGVARDDGLVCGCHVHIGTLDRERALALAQHMRPWLPVLQALAGNSPYAARHDTGYQSWRAVEHARWPTVGPTPVLDEPQYLAHVARLVREGTLLDNRMVYWHARPSEHVPTLEIRVADANAELDTVVLLAILVRGLAATLLPRVDAGVPAPVVPGPVLLRAHRLAASQGIAGAGLDPVGGGERPAARLLDALITLARPGLDAAGDTDWVCEQWERIRVDGGGAARQRDVFRRHGRFSAVVDALADATMRS
ncbi:putative glutamate--cysteine ligase 2 [Streptomyces litmocidini]|uniref:carboxylate-amine ligase n=1 Tax=Streptomyces litmocidini TaxID=67318 RepID=UPI00167CA6AF|nr:glutamate--cysteine ligase [Streptomyces litmocidini]GGU98336.1 putative glutamate--cysteine ligase 2 [Streptomyces litmocidini]